MTHQDNVETCKLKHDINEPVDEEQLKFSSEEDSFPFGKIIIYNI